jgi:hypothetical protein
VNLGPAFAFLLTGLRGAAEPDGVRWHGVRTWGRPSRQDGPGFRPGPRFLGMLLIGPVTLKACSASYRFLRYYSGAAGYRRKGPPPPLLRVLGPVVLLTSVAVIGTGVMLALTGPGGTTWLFLHKASFVLWFCAMTVHVLAYLWRLPHLVRGDLASGAGRRATQVLAGRAARWLLLTASVLTGLLLAVLTTHWAGAWTGLLGPAH